MTNKNEKHSIQQDVLTEEQEPLTELEPTRSDVICKLELLLRECDDIEKEMIKLEMGQEFINTEFHEIENLFQRR